MTMPSLLRSTAIWASLAPHGYRVKSADLGRGRKEDLSLHQQRHQVFWRDPRS
jgi:hypothetical protein